MHPRLAVYTAAKEAPSSDFVYRVAIATLQDPSYRRAGAAKMFIRHIIHGQPSTGFPHWYHSAIGIVNVFQGIHIDNTQVEDAAILQELHSSYWKMLDIFWEDRHFLQGQGPFADNKRVIVSEFIRMNLRSNPRLKLQMYERKTITLVMDCWLKNSMDDDDRELSIAAAHEMLKNPNDVNGDPPDDYLDIFFNIVDIEYLVSQVACALNHKTNVGSSLARELSVITALAFHPEPFVPYFIEGGLYKQVKIAMRRQLKFGGDETEDVLAQSSMILWLVSESSSDFMATFAEMLENSWVIEAGALDLIMACKSGSTNADAWAWFNFFSNIQHIVTCKESEACPSCKGPVPDLFVRAARTSLERVAIPIWQALPKTETPGPIYRYTALWYDLIDLLGITPESTRKRYRLERKCCNLNCPTRLSGSRSEKKSTCVKCHSVFYCDRACQRSDWNDAHKNECKKYAEGGI